MPRKFVLSWQPGDDARAGRWRKKYRGKVYYFPGGRGKTDRDGYQAAVMQWEQLKVQIDAAAPKPHLQEYEREISQWEQVLTWCRQHQEEDMATLATTMLAKLREALQPAQPKPVNKLHTFAAQFDPQVRYPLRQASFAALSRAMDELHANQPTADLSAGPVIVPAAETRQDRSSPLAMEQQIWQDRLEVMARNATPAEKTLQAHLERFLHTKQAAATAGDISANRAYTLRLHLTHFCEWRGGQTPVVEVDGQSLNDYRLELLKQVQANAWSRTTAKDRLASVKSFVRWLWQVEAIPTLPRSIDSHALRISKPSPSIVTFTTTEISSLLAAASERTQLYILLMLNCGMTQKDIADLKLDEVDWGAGRIVRKRSKTKKFATVPEVRYLLWDKTLRLLQQERSTESTGLVLRNENGEPLWFEAVDAAGKLRKMDNIRNAFHRVAKKTNITKPAKSFRKTSANLLRSNGQFASLAGLFLGHAPVAVADKHYTRPPQQLLDEAVTWLAEQYGLVTNAELPKIRNG